jgi:hypothetical protein
MSYQPIGNGSTTASTFLREKHVSTLLKIAIGLALKSELYRGRINTTLYDLYDNPDQRDVIQYHTTLITSDHHADRETAFWLELAIPKPPERIDLAAIIDVLRKMEVILYDLLMQINPNLQTDLNDWLNYIANIPHMLERGSGIDAKCLISQALDSSKASTIEVMKSDPKLARKLQILQQETQHLYHQILCIPMKLAIPQEQQQPVLQLQHQILELLKIGMKQMANTPNYQYGLQKLEHLQTQLMNLHVSPQLLKKDITQAISNLQQSYKEKELPRRRSQLRKIIQALQAFSKFR